MNIETVLIDTPQEYNVIIGTSHFIKTIRDLSKVVEQIPGVKYGLAFCEASGKRLIRSNGNDSEVQELAVKAAQQIACGHSFIIILKNAFPVQILNDIKSVEEVCTVHCATANPLKVVVMEEGDQRGILGVLDGQVPLGVESESDVKDREELLKKLGY
jgi:uncharacterized protein